MFKIAELFSQLPNPALPSEMMGQIIALYQHDAFFRLAHEKVQRRDHLIDRFNGRQPTRIYISNNLRHLSPRKAAVGVGYLERDFFLERNASRFAEKCTQLAGSVVIVNNNDAHKGGVAEAYVKFFESCPNTIFIAWDWDNHHWLSLSTVLAAHSDLYVPTHGENHYLLSRYNADITDAVAAGLTQWTTAFLRQHLADILQMPRSDSPLGMHIPYATFQYRNRVVATMQPHYATIGFSTHQFHQLTPEEKFTEWVSHKLHWIVPVLNDIPIRVFDALGTGGIPLIPDTLRYSHWLADAHPDDVLCYSAADILQPEPLVQRACRLFDRYGEEGMQRRFDYALEWHHGDVRIAMMLDAAARLYSLRWRVSRA